MAGLLAGAVIGWLLPVQPASGATVQFSATINGAQETPPTASLSVWTGTFTMDTLLDTLTITVTDTMVGPLLGTENGAHIHGFAGPGVPAGILFGLPLGSPKNAVWNFAPAQEASIIAGLTYVNIHTTAFPLGEIRGQILRVPGCGDGILDGGEACDDGNNANGDCCDATCQLEPDGSSCGVGATCETGVCNTPNHYLCRQVKDLKSPAKFAAITGISVVDQTGSDTCEAKKPFLLCDPVNKNGGGIANPALHYCCYKLKCGLKPAVAYTVTDQFWTGTISTKKPKFLCNPCDTAPAP
jgi:cysteine-rich repeat protein